MVKKNYAVIFKNIETFYSDNIKWFADILIVEFLKYFIN
jgi:hypothetical protein